MAWIFSRAEEKEEDQEKQETPSKSSVEDNNG